MKGTFFILLTAIMLSGCRSIMLRVAGIKPLKPIPTNSFTRLEKKFGLTETRNFYDLDTAYFSWIKKMSEGHKKQASALLQPIQVFYFDDTDSCLVHLNGCGFPGFPNPNYNAFNTFASFPPNVTSGEDQVNLLRKINLPELASFITNSDSLRNNQGKYHVVIFWSAFYNRQAKRWIKCIRKNASLSAYPVEVVSVNLDNFYLKTELLSE